VRRHTTEDVDERHDQDAGNGPWRRLRPRRL